MSTTYDEARQFATDNIAPYSQKIDEEAQFPTEIFKRIGDAGYLKLLIPKERGGRGGTLQDHVDVCLAFAEGNPSVALCYMMHNVAMCCLLQFGSSELQEKVLTDVIENQALLALAASEFGSGTHFNKPEIDVKVDGDTHVFNGAKSMVTCASYAQYYAVVAPYGGGGTDNWLIPRDTPGISFQEEEWRGIGMRGNVSCPMQFDNVAVDVFYRVGEAGSGGNQTKISVIPPFMLGLAAIYTAVSLQLLKITTDYSQKRVYPDGQALSHIETVQIHLSNIYLNAQASRALTQAATAAAMAGDADAVAKIFAARVFASESAIESGRLAMRIG
ncbi:MAG: acyl-CoA/acyl-ACP dehydrogenase, partial [Coriobacteriales bacterium]|nr:acyl-CoA/acyl-ACP dehydrogenase [Coriobacteriales bacterium]